jgi:regulator of protease activity HflC (stomatin/prohibitin superfamily)
MDYSGLIGLVFVGVLIGGGISFLYLISGFLIVQPRTQVVVLRFGVYKHTLTTEGIKYVFPFGRRLYRLSSQLISVDLPRLMVLEANGNPIEVSAVCLYRVKEAQKAVLEIEDYHQYVTLLATCVVKNVCSHYPYESPDPHAPCLKKESKEVSDHLVKELNELAAPAGIEIHEVRLNDLTYAPEIAQSMLMRQQALAMVDARRTIVEGATATVTDAARRMKDEGIALTPAHSETFIANLMLVLCSGERVATVLPIDLEPSATASPLAGKPTTLAGGAS